MNNSIIITLLSLQLTITALLGQTYTQQTHFARLSYETINITSAETMGMVGVNLELNRFLSQPTYLGIGGYGALVGDRGGFFTAGITPGLRFSLKGPLIYDIGLFIGGGGGASAFPGDGLMIRSHAYVGYPFNHSLLWTGLSWQEISNQDLGLNISMALSKPLTIFTSKSNQPSSTIKPSQPIQTLTNKRLQVLLSKLNYYPLDSTMNRNNVPIASSIPLLHLELEYDWINSINAMFSLSGANGQGADGYGSIFTGLAYKTTVSNLQISPQLKIGMAGGGNIDTGGGFMISPAVKLNYPLFKQLYLSSSLGYIAAPSGTFAAFKAAIGLTWEINKLTNNHHPKQLNSQLATITSIQKPHQIKWFVENKTTWPTSSLLTKGGDYYEPTIQFFGCGAKLPIKSWLDLMVATYWAYDGEVGAYAEGNFGLVISRQLSQYVSLGAEFSIGAAGGGGIDVNQGTIHQEAISLNYHVTKTNVIAVKYGWQAAFASTAFQGPIMLIGIQRSVSFL